MNLKFILSTAVAVVASVLVILSLYEEITAAITDDCSGNRFCSFYELREVYEEGEDWEIEKSSAGNERWLVSAIHGGGIEEATSTLAEAIAGSSYPFYSFKGRLKSNNFSNLHITSTRFDEPEALEMVANAEYHISIHGSAGDEPKTMIGGLDKDMKEIVSRHLEENGFEVAVTPEHLNGDHPDNFTNKTKTERGVQLEITRAQRKAFFKNGDISFSSRNNSSNQTEEFKIYVEAIQSSMKEYE
ncbi:poly-gamma-glutamate hydrolase family protein [Halobacillus sp. Marseille-Q1614]|uniref:poly-gamma-glutamate hydrolase family protein n=1 Tax=Halobacillus sp. Marseille-Q1614 TaxID=2709134 RepID=UPI00156FFC56|nr:poly-gamma-glutamate hydrolase family protein [Halobacillus sp. Marseille-Q1614]